MTTQLEILLDKIKTLENELIEELQKQEEEFPYEIRKRKVYFEENSIIRHREYVKHMSFFDRQFLNYLNIIEKINCAYCSYMNGLIAYVQEIAARTEQFWCPIKHARRIKNLHSRYQKFINYGDAETYRSKIEIVRRDFKDLQ